MDAGEKVFRTTINFNADERPITWSQFCKEPLPDRTFTFWDWFYAVMKLTRDQLRGPWTEGLIIGFINKRQAEEMLLKCSPGTFLLRFSDSELGKHLVILYVLIDCWANGILYLFSVHLISRRNNHCLG